jgi:flagellin
MLSPLGQPGRDVFTGLTPLRQHERMADRSMRRLATGRAINSGSDDPAGLIAGVHLDAAIRALDAESRSLQRRADVLATKDGALAAASDMTAELKAIAVEAASSSTLSDAEKHALEVEAASIVRAIEHTTGSATFAGEKLFDSSLATELGATEGVDPDSGDPATYTLADVGRTLDLFDDPAMIASIADAAVSDLAVIRAEIGAEVAIDIEPRTHALGVEMVNLSSAHSLIVDTDYARETAALMRTQTLAQASRFLLALDGRNSTLALNLLAGAA